MTDHTANQRIAGVDVFIDGPPQAPALLMVHGWPDTHRLWDRQVEALRGRLRCVRFTLPGFEAGAPRRRYSLDDVVGTLAAVADAVSPSAPVLLMLHDWGCLFGYQFALRQPQRVARVIGIDIGDAGSRAHVAELSALSKVMIVGYQLWLAIASWLGGRVGDTMARRMARTAHAPAWRGATAQGSYPYAVQWFDRGYRTARRALPAYPMLFVYGSRKPFMFHSRAWAGAVAARPGCAVAEFDCGHW